MLFRSIAITCTCELLTIEHTHTSLTSRKKKVKNQFPNEPRYLRRTWDRAPVISTGALSSNLSSMPVRHEFDFSPWQQVTMFSLQWQWMYIICPPFYIFYAEENDPFILIPSGTQLCNGKAVTKCVGADCGGNSISCLGFIEAGSVCLL